MDDERQMIESLSVYIPMDRRQTLARGETLPDRTTGAALFADISGFTPLMEALAHELGPQRGPEELTRHLNRVYDALIGELYRYGGSVIGFSGDAITCWFDGDPGLRATACALAMQQAMKRFATVTIPSGSQISLAMKAAVATGAARRFLVGDPQIQIIDALAGAILDHLAEAEHLAAKGEVVLDPATVAALGEDADIFEWRQSAAMGKTSQAFGVVSGLAREVRPALWPPLPPQALDEEQVRPWLLLPIYERLRSGQGEFLAELRPAVALFLRFGGIDYDGDEDAGAKLDTFIRQAQEILKGYEGTLLQLTIGDKGSYFYTAFGAPLAHEDDAVRAASAALDLRKLATTLDFITGVQIGISQGRMRTGAYGGASRRTYGVLGDEVNLAARLMVAAVPGQILVSKAARQAAARQATGDHFNWENLPDIRVKGKTEPVTIFSLAGVKERRAVRLLEPTAALRVPMVGRAAELALAEDKLDQALQGKGQLLGITAEAGIGKSRLVDEIVRLASERGIVGYGGECLSYGTQSSYLVWQPIWRSLFGIDPAWDVAKQIKVLTRQLRLIDPALLPRVPLLGPALNLIIPHNDLTRSFDAKLRKTSLEALLVDCLRGRAQMAPMLLRLEDCQWLDPLSHDLLEAIGRAIANLPVLLVMAYRPPESDRSQALRVRQLAHFTEIQLTDFTPDEAERLIGLKLEQLSGVPGEAPHRLVKRITEQAGGNPFYIEEMLYYLQSPGIDPQDSQELEQRDLPTSLHSLVLARIDQLTENQKTTLRLASIVGRSFKAGWLWGAYPQSADPQRTSADLEILRRLDFTQLDTPEPELAYLFKHIITQEVTYQSLPHATRAMLHDYLGQFMERTFSETIAQYVRELARHYWHSENEAKKREYLLMAGEAAQADYANAAAIDYYRRALPLLPAEEQVAVMLKLGQVLELVGTWGEAGDVYRQALEQAGRRGDRPAEARCQMAIGELFSKQGQYADASMWFDQARAVFEELGDEAGVGQALHSAGTLAARQGNYEAARALYENSLVIRRRLNDKPNIANLLSNLGVIARSQGDYSLARTLYEEGLALRRELGDRRAIAMSRNNLGNVALDQGNYAEARSWLEEAVTLQREVGDKREIANALNNLGNVARAQGDYTTAHSLYHESLALHRELGDKWDIAYLLEDIGWLAALQHQPQRALRLVGAAATLREAIHAPLSPADQVKLERALEPARRALGEANQATAQAEGQAMGLEQAVDYALNTQHLTPGA